MNFEDEDVPFEEDCIRNPYSLKSWLRYIDFKSKAGANTNWIGVYLVYERALKQLPGSYKLWYAYLKLRRAHLKTKSINDSEYEEVNNAYERALAYMSKVHYSLSLTLSSLLCVIYSSRRSQTISYMYMLDKMPRIWIDYCEFLFEQCLVTRTRKACDRALRSLPVTQHNRIWPIFLKLVETYDIPETGYRVYKRYSKLVPEDAERHADYLKKIGLIDECAQKYLFMLNNEDFVSKHGKSKHQVSLFYIGIM